MPDIPHWSIRFKKGAGKRRARPLECTLVRGDHLNAPLVPYKALASIPEDKLDDAGARYSFWQAVFSSMASLPPDLIGEETQKALFRKILRRVGYERPYLPPIERRPRSLSDYRPAESVSPSLWQRFLREQRAVVPPVVLRRPIGESRALLLESMVEKMVKE